MEGSLQLLCVVVVVNVAGLVAVAIVVDLVGVVV
jgi:hypothetical protein